MKRLIQFVILAGLQTAALAQQPDQPAPMGFQRKFLWGVTYQQCWSTISGSPLAANYFAKPSIGGSLVAEYDFASFMGVSVGLGYQQRGAGIVNPGKTPGSDSTYRERLRFNTIEIPLSLVLRTPNDLFPGVRLGGTISMIPMINFRSHDVINILDPSIQDANIVTDVSSSYFKNDVAWQLTIGPEFGSAGPGVIKVHFLYSRGTTNVYTASQGTGHNQTMGVRLAILF